VGLFIYVAPARLHRKGIILASYELYNRAVNRGHDKITDVITVQK
tara:strand:+ start:53 stop:187 length:135 start_codon:yes stop_codon:yes gene_type:complete